MISPKKGRKPTYGQTYTFRVSLTRLASMSLRSQPNIECLDASEQQRTVALCRIWTLDLLSVTEARTDAARPRSGTMTMTSRHALM